MKLVKMSMVAALLVGSSAFAIENTKVSGDASLLYATSDVKGGTANVLAGETGSGSLFDKDSSGADAVLNLDVTTDLVSNDLVKISAGAGYTVLSTLGLENNLVSNVWGGGHTATANTGASYASNTGSHPSSPFTGVKVENANYFTEAWMAATAGKTTLKLGRMELDTPIAFSEKWSAEVNTFEAIVAINQDLPDTTVVGAYVGNGNGNEDFGSGAGDNTVQTLGLAFAPVVNGGGKFRTFGTDGAYALGVINNSFKPLTVQAWYYNVSKLVTSYWLQADLNMEGILAGVQYNSMEAVGSGTKEDTVYAAMLGYEMKDVVTVKAAYSATSDDGSLGAAGFNAATSTGNTKLYTKTFWNYGNQVTANDTTAMKLSAHSPVNGIVDLCASYTGVEHGNTTNPSKDFTEIALVAKKSFGPLDVKAALINVDDETANDDYNMVQAYLTLNF